MNNLANSKPTADQRIEINRRVQSELTDAGIPVKEIGLQRASEVPTIYGGEMILGGHAFKFWRAWCYWVVECSPGLPKALAQAINDTPHEGPRGHYCGNRGTLGDVARIGGFAGGHEPLSWTGRVEFKSWNIDTAEGLRDFVKELRTRLGGERHA